MSEKYAISQMSSTFVAKMVVRVSASALPFSICQFHSTTFTYQSYLNEL
ncbi:hypothetical protein [Bacillus toyonensis]|nr:hypothetical protein [Bacillus toyonensis]MED2691764.1 hypothetical protein [Bacillus toyonensis]